eukprot:m.339548 g.339548  ORF g.339548 m.339548 type:complete len:257 (+) comp55750_c1_seq3:2549-3319(+)
MTATALLLILFRSLFFFVLSFPFLFVHSASLLSDSPCILVLCWCVCVCVHVCVCVCVRVFVVQIADQLLMTLRIEIRAHCLYYLLPCIRKSNYDCDISMVEADLQIVSLGKDLLTIESALKLCLLPRAVQYIMDGLPQFISEVFVQNLKSIHKISTFGVKRMCRGIFALQQTFQKILDEQQVSALDRARQYYELLNLQPPQLVEYAQQDLQKEHPDFNDVEYRMLVGLICASQIELDPSIYSETISTIDELFHDML